VRSKLIAILLSLTLFPFLLFVLFLVLIIDKQWPIFVSPRVGLNGVSFNLYKLKTMATKPELNHIVTTSVSDPRITSLGKILRRTKIDEMLQLINIIKGEMTFIGPRPNVPAEVKKYSKTEKSFLDIKPGLSDLSSLFFSDLNLLLRDSKDANEDYENKVRPLKSEITVMYIDMKCLTVDFKIFFASIVAIFNPELARAIALKLIGLHYGEMASIKLERKFRKCFQ